MAYFPQSIVVIAIFLPLLAIIAVCLRFWVRLYVQPTHIGIDDWLIVGALILCLADGANLAMAAILGIQGRNYQTQVPPQRSDLEAKSDYAQVILEKPLFGILKLSVLFFFRRIFQIQRRFRMFNNIMIVLVLAWTIAYTFAEAFECDIHPEVQWSGGDNSHVGCVDQNSLDLSFAITDVVGDVLVISMPYPCIRALHMSKRERTGLALIFLLGTLSTVASIIRLGFIVTAFTANYGNGGNTHSSGTPPAVWSTIEAAVGVLAANLPPLGALIRKAPNPYHVSIIIYRGLLSPFRKSNGIFQTQTNPSKADGLTYQVPRVHVEQAHHSRDEVEMNRSEQDIV